MFGMQQIVGSVQIGADRAALDWAFEHGAPRGGWCSRGCTAEAADFRIKTDYILD